MALTLSICISDFATTYIYGCDLSCNLHTGVHIASMAVVTEDLRLRNIRHNRMYKTLLDVLHMPMRTNEKVLTLLYEEVTQGAHKAQASSVMLYTTHNVVTNTGLVLRYMLVCAF